MRMHQSIYPVSPLKFPLQDEITIEILTILSNHAVGQTQRNPDSMGLISMGMSMYIIYNDNNSNNMYVYHVYVMYSSMPNRQLSKYVPSRVTAAATVLEAVQVREYLKINVLGTIPYFVDGNVKILRQHIQNSLVWDCVVASQKNRNIHYHGQS